MTPPETIPEIPEVLADLPPEAIRLWEIVAEVWNTSFLGASVGQGLLALLVVAISLMLRGLVGRWVISALLRLTARTKTKVDEMVVRALKGPITLIPVIVGLFLAFSILGFQGVAGSGDRVVQSLITVALFWALHNAVTPVSRTLEGLRSALTPVMVDWIVKALRLAFVVIGAAAVLSIWDIPVAPMVASLGLFGIAVGLGAQDLVKNLIAGILILSEKRFLPGDWIKVEGVVEGIVERINFRSTLVRRFDKGPVYVPNSELADNPVINFSRMTHRRIYWIIGVEYRTTTAQLAQIRDRVLSFVLEHPEFAKPPEVSTFMRVDSFNASSIDFMLYCFTNTTNWGEWLRLKEELAFEIKRVVEEAGTSFAFPSQTIYFAEGAEAFAPPAKPAKPAKRAAS